MEVHELMALARNLTEVCPRCNGSGNEPPPGPPTATCQRCKGTCHVIKPEYHHLHAFIRTLVEQDPEH